MAKELTSAIAWLLVIISQNLWRVGQVPENQRTDIVPAFKKMEKGTLKKPYISQPNFKQVKTEKNKLDIVTFVNDSILEGTGNTRAP